MCSTVRMFEQSTGTIAVTLCRNKTYGYVNQCGLHMELDNE
jgi:hypothetical protein